VRALIDAKKAAGAGRSAPAADAEGQDDDHTAG
jgi:hypothetical protein